MFASVDRIRQWLIGTIATAINKLSSEKDRLLAVEQLMRIREILASDMPRSEKNKRIQEIINARGVLSAAMAAARAAIENYKNAKLPLSIKIAIPITLGAAMLVGGQGAGIAAFGTAVGVPALLLIFIGATGVSAIIEAVLKHDGEHKPHIAAILDQIINDEPLLHANTAMRAAMREQVADAIRYPMPEDEEALRARLLDMDPFLFVQHVMGFFQAAGLNAWATRKSNDFDVGMASPSIQTA